MNFKKLRRKRKIYGTGLLYVLCYYEAPMMLRDIMIENGAGGALLFWIFVVAVYFEGKFVFKINHNYICSRYGQTVASYLSMLYVFLMLMSPAFYGLFRHCEHGLSLLFMFIFKHY